MMHKATTRTPDGLSVEDSMTVIAMLIDHHRAAFKRRSTFAFAVAEQARLFPPRSDNITSTNTTNKGTTSTPLRRIYSDDTPTDSLTNTSLALTLPFLPTTDAQTGKICLCENMTQ